MGILHTGTIGIGDISGAVAARGVSPSVHDVTTTSDRLRALASPSRSSTRPLVQSPVQPRESDHNTTLHPPPPPIQCAATSSNIPYPVDPDDTSSGLSTDPPDDTRPYPSIVTRTVAHTDPSIESIGTSSAQPHTVPDTAAEPDKTDARRRSTLAALAGVRSTDTAHEEHRLRRDRPRLAIRPIHMFGAILLLATLLCASLTMLLQQAMRYERALSAAQTSVSADGTDGVNAVASDDDVDKARDDARDGTGNDADAVVPDSAMDDRLADDTGTASTMENDTDDAANGANDSGHVDGGADAADDGRIDLNTATSAQLQTVKGIGPVTAERILAHRDRIGRFTSVDQLLDIKGIGAKTLAKIRDAVTVR
ncbi:competence protein ComEA [Bifidobacterium ramosum]|uniref:Competence protein ComEA n=1 Tax=Bifidobacterium ramosum TaxID=1798158 RepID=A0A6L4WZU6_9BIFI|nr:helix-hairpin-helix domain-containing protein [Bifidobacterium ramosum]KAB8287672.1 competence protein ComEA [Bifidobacterium ramosum]NEG72298.1 hypothetical protein [Bifidobacterium ramosum]